MTPKYEMYHKGTQIFFEIFYWGPEKQAERGDKVIFLFFSEDLKIKYEMALRKLIRRNWMGTVHRPLSNYAQKSNNVA